MQILKLLMMKRNNYKFILFLTVSFLFCSDYFHSEKSVNWYTGHINIFYNDLNYNELGTEINLNNLKIERNLSGLSSLPRISLEFVTIFLFTVLVIFFKDNNNLKFVSIMALYAVAAMKIIPSVAKILQDESSIEQTIKELLARPVTTE